LYYEFQYLVIGELVYTMPKSLTLTPLYFCIVVHCNLTFYLVVMHSDAKTRASILSLCTETHLNDVGGLWTVCDDRVHSGGGPSSKPLVHKLLFDSSNCKFNKRFFGDINSMHRRLDTCPTCRVASIPLTAAAKRNETTTTDLHRLVSRLPRPI